MIAVKLFILAPSASPGLGLEILLLPGLLSEPASFATATGASGAGVGTTAVTYGTTTLLIGNFVQKFRPLLTHLNIGIGRATAINLIGYIASIVQVGAN